MSYQRHITQLGANLIHRNQATKASPIPIPTPRKPLQGMLYNSVITRFYKNL